MKQKTKNKKYLVVGGAGFIGSNLVDKLIQLNHKVVVLDNLSTGKKENINPRVKFIKGDMRSLKQIEPSLEGVDGVFLLAALPRVQYSIENPIKTNRNNVDGVLNVLVASQEAGVKRVVYSASSSAYGDVEKMPLREDLKARPLSPYGLQKYIGEEYCRLFSLIHGLETVSLRYFNVYGKRMSSEGAYVTVMSIFLRQLKKNQPLTITNDGGQTRDFTNIEDVVRANILAMDSRKVGYGEVINIGGNKNYSINEIAKLFLEYSFGKEIKFNDKVKYIPSRIEPRHTLADVSLAKKMLGWQPKVKLEDGVMRLLKIK